jgi:hypothetical protein
MLRQASRRVEIRRPLSSLGEFFHRHIAVPEFALTGGSSICGAPATERPAPAAVPAPAKAAPTKRRRVNFDIADFRCENAPLEHGNETVANRNLRPR